MTNFFEVLMIHGCKDFTNLPYRTWKTRGNTKNF